MASDRLSFEVDWKFYCLLLGLQAFLTSACLGCLGRCCSCTAFVVDFLEIPIWGLVHAEMIGLEVGRSCLYKSSNASILSVNV